VPIKCEILKIGMNRLSLTLFGEKARHKNAKPKKQGQVGKGRRSGHGKIIPNNTGIKRLRIKKKVLLVCGVID
tara:strand:+ start:9032 stop:9250 length:219 start_codon:yes stop_codon:yes gene_type:complete